MIDEIRKARNWINLMNPVYLDTETTGLGSGAEICSIAVIDDAGHVLLDTLVKPALPIPPDATEIHGITDADVAAAPGWETVWPQVCELVRNRLVIIYNADYDLRLINQSGLMHAVHSNLLDWSNTECAMRLYADFHAEWDAYHGNNRWINLVNACRQMRVGTAGILPHSAAGDCELTRRLVHALAEHQAVPA